MVVILTKATHMARRFQWLGPLLVTLTALHQMVPQITSAEEPVKPLGYRRLGELEMIAWLRYETPRGERRVLRVVREMLTLDRLLTDRETAESSAFYQSKNERDTDLFRPNNTFQQRSQQLVLWIMDCEANFKLDEGQPLGVVYAQPGPCGPILKSFAADLLWHASREQFLLVLSMSCSTDLTLAIFPLDLDAKMEVKPFGIAGKFPAEWPRPESKWPKPLTPIAEMRTTLPVDICDIMAIRAVPETRDVKRDDTEAEERNLLISAWNIQSPSCNSVMYRYKLREREWRLVKLRESEDEPVKICSEDSKRLEQILEIPPEDGDPGLSRRTKPLEPIPDPQPSQRSSSPSVLPK